MAKPHMCEPSTLSKNLDGHVYVVTGANSGIGLVTAGQLAKQGAHVVFACRRTGEADAEIARLRSAQPGLSAESMRLDLGDLASVRAFAETFLAKHDRLDGLINNAGVMNTSQGRTKDGFETQIGINHFGHFLLTESLLEVLQKSAPSRVVCVSSCFHDKAQGREGEIDFDDLHFERRAYDGWKAYAQSKLANVLHAKELAKRLDGTGVTAVSVHPGWVRTNLARNTMPVWLQNTLMRPVFKFMGMIEPWEGAQTTLHAALADDIPQHNGAYFSQLGLYRDKSANKGGWPLVSPNPQAKDDAIAARFYDLSLELTGAGQGASA